MTPVDAKPEDNRLAAQNDDKDSSSSSSTASKEHGESGKHWDKPVMLKRGATGRVKWFNLEKEFGFIVVDGEDESESVFVHSSSIITIVPRIKCALADGERVEFDIVQNVKGREAIAVTGPEGKKAGARRIDRYARHYSESPLRSSRRRARRGPNVEETLAENVAKLNIRNGGKMARREGRVPSKPRYEDSDSSSDVGYQAPAKKGSQRQGVLIVRSKKHDGGK